MHENFVNVVSVCSWGWIDHIPWIHSLKARHEQQKELEFLIEKSFSRSSKYIWYTWKKNLIENKLILQQYAKSMGRILKIQFKNAILKR